MRYVLTLLVAAMALAGCQQKDQAKGPAPTGTPPPGPTDVQPVQRPLESLTPVSEPTPPPRKEIVSVRPVVRPTESTELTAPTPLVPGRGYTIQKGDTLFSISKKMLGEGKRWPDIKAMNPGLEESRLPVGKTINIPEK
jgi:nucleoid-associated protein YgaU